MASRVWGRGYLVVLVQVACLIDVLRCGESLGPSGPGVSSNVVAARHTVSYFPHFVWTGDGNISGIIFLIHAQSREKPFLTCVESACRYHMGLPSIISHGLSKPTSCVATTASPRSPSQTFDIASMC